MRTRMPATDGRAERLGWRGRISDTTALALTAAVARTHTLLRGDHQPARLRCAARAIRLVTHSRDV